MEYVIILIIQQNNCITYYYKWRYCNKRSIKVDTRNDFVSGGYFCNSVFSVIS
jgi:hypothetical protein